MLKTFTIATTAALALLAGPVLAEGDAEKGERVFNKCKNRHDR